MRWTWHSAGPHPRWRTGLAPTISVEFTDPVGERHDFDLFSVGKVWAIRYRARPGLILLSETRFGYVAGEVEKLFALPAEAAGSSSAPLPPRSPSSPPSGAPRG